MPNVDSKLGAQVFSLRVPVMEQGGFGRGVLAETDDIRVGWISCTNTGEDRLHTHPNQPHVFFVLSGTMIIRDREGNEVRLKQYEGILIPEGHYYSFVTDGDEPCVVLRFNGYSDKNREYLRVTPQGTGLDVEHWHSRTVPGLFFPA